MTCGSPPCHPQATLADVTQRRISSSAPIVYAPNDSPMSLFRSMCIVTSAISASAAAGQPRPV
ncbi:MAG: hypothetical protein MZV64_17015 [Ignavibacteriales bacterium]|nr:hypothetical protein [Ignavibacteriales bacterium]